MGRYPEYPTTFLISTGGLSFPIPRLIASSHALITLTSTSLMDQGWLRGPWRIAALEKTGSTTECGCLSGDGSFEKTGERFIRRQLFVPALRLIREASRHVPRLFNIWESSTIFEQHTFTGVFSDIYNDWMFRPDSFSSFGQIVVDCICC